MTWWQVFGIAVVVCATLNVWLGLIFAHVEEAGKTLKNIEGSLVILDEIVATLHQLESDLKVRKQPNEWA